MAGIDQIQVLGLAQGGGLEPRTALAMQTEGFKLVSRGPEALDFATQKPVEVGPGSGAPLAEGPDGLALDVGQLEGPRLQVQQQPGRRQFGGQLGEGGGHRGGSQLHGHGPQTGPGQEVEAAVHRFPRQGHQHDADLGVSLTEDLIVIIEALGRQGQKAVQFIAHHLGQVLGRSLRQGRRA